jgi:hypothetical protein
VEFDKYFYYEASVQNPKSEVDFLKNTYRSIRKKTALSLREDFSGTFQVALEWARQSPKHNSVAIDLDPEPLAYGQQRLRAGDRKKIQVLEKNVLACSGISTDIVCALNFSYLLFKQRQELKKYFRSVFKSLDTQGIFVMDLFGGSESLGVSEEETQHKDFSYFWEQESYCPITHHALFHIHFKRKGERKRKKVFTYDWRLWTLPELSEVLMEVGFSDVRVYWEGSKRNGEGNGVFSWQKKGEPCESWIAYVVALR